MRSEKALMIGPPVQDTRADALIEALDGRAFLSGGANWRAWVLGVHMDGDDAWVQLSLVGPVESSVVLHVLPTVEIDQATLAVHSWLGSASAIRPRVIEV